MLTDGKSVESILLRSELFYEKNHVEMLLGQSVENINKNDKSVTLSSEKVLSYSKLVLCTGSNPIYLNLPGETLKGIGYLRDFGDVDRLSKFVKKGKRAVLVGGGYIGLEAAAALRSFGMEVTILESMDRILRRVTEPEISAFYTNAHTTRGVNIVTNAQVSAFSGEEQVQEVICNNGQRFPADLVIIGVGVRPNVMLAEKVGIEVDNGIVVNAQMLTSDPDIYAIGDCASFPSPLTEARIRLESVPNANEQAKCAAASLCGKLKTYDAVPWFWSDQFNMKLQIAGLSHGYNNMVLRGDTMSEKFSAWYFKEDILLAVDCINSPADFITAKNLLTARKNPDKHLIALSEETILV
jgi:3-phenylpropionate/trans-cinnamate dioxygenase ferredoxin reductase subunit